MYSAHTEPLQYASISNLLFLNLSGETLESRLRLVQIQRQLGRLAFQHLKAARHGLAEMRDHFRAQFLIALGLGGLPLERIYLAGEGVPKDPVEGARWLAKAAEQNVSAAYGQLGALYAEGRGLPYLELEIRQDLIADADGQRAWAARLIRLLPEAYRQYQELPKGHAA